MSGAKAKGEAIYQRVVKAVVDGVTRLVFVAADEYSAEMAKAKKLREGDLLRVWYGKPRDFKSWKRIHKLGQLMVENVDGFEHLTAHEAVKKLQVEAEVQCDPVTIAGIDYTCPDCAAVHEIPDLVVMTPRSLAFDELDETVFNEVYGAIAKHIRTKYWPDMSEFDLEQMASLVGMGT